jgi:uncharacterized membrane protein YphA (DoxX/SURF4 family)
MPGISAVSSRLLVPAWILVLAGLQIADGTTDVLPIWMIGMGHRLGADAVVILRLLLGAELLVAGLMLLIGRWSRMLAILSMCFACFSGIASISAAPESGRTWALSGAVVAISALLLSLVTRGGRRRGTPLSLQWQLIGALAVGVISAIVAVQLPIRLVDAGIDGRFRPVRPLNAVEIDLLNSVGRPLAECGIREHLPQLVAATMEGRSFVVFYNPRCGSCHDLFRDHFAGEVEGKVFAVSVPPPAGEELLPSDQPEEVTCDQCTFMRLEPGTIWQIEPRVPPIVVVIQDGVIECVGTECLQ